MGGGTVTNVIPDKAVLQGFLRSFFPKSEIQGIMLWNGEVSVVIWIPLVLIVGKYCKEKWK